MVNRDAILKEYRAELDALDDQILGLFAKRYRIRDKVMAAKIAHGMDVVAPDRVAAILDRLEGHAKALDIPPEFARALYTVVLDYSHEYERQFRSRAKV